MSEIRHPNVVCCECKKPIYRRLKQSKSGLFFCNKVCYGRHCRKVFPCPVCGKEILSGQRAKTCSRACANIRRTGIKYDGKQSRSRSSRNTQLKQVLMTKRGPRCEICDYDNTNILQAHHIVKRANDGTDDLTNLKLLCPNCHCTIHLGDSRKEDELDKRASTALKATSTLTECGGQDLRLPNF